MEQAKTIGVNELARLVGVKAGSFSSEISKKYINSLVKVISEELILAGEIRISGLGTFVLVDAGGYDKLMPNLSGGQDLRYVEPYLKVKFYCSEVLKDTVNGKRIMSGTPKETRTFNKKLKHQMEKEALMDSSNMNVVAQNWLNKHRKEKEEERLARIREKELIKKKETPRYTPKKKLTKTNGKMKGKK